MKSDNKAIYIPIIGIVIAELMMFYGDINYGFGLHLLNLLVIIFMVIFLSLELKIKNVLHSLMLIIILRIVSLSLPRFPESFQYPLIYGIMLIPIFSVIKNQHISLKELGIDFKKFYLYIPIAMYIGIIMGNIEFKILHPAYNTGFSNIIYVVIIMFLFIGLVEELIFRSILQTRIEQIIGPRFGIIISGIIFGMMHSSYGIMNEILFASIFGIILGLIFYKTKSLPFTISIHGSANIILYTILPRII